MTVAGALLVLGGPAAGGGASSAIGAAAVVGAALAWAIDNTATRRLADRDAMTIVLAKGALGASGYGLSLRLYLTAQRTLGAGRTASAFAIGPFVGAGATPLVGEPWPGAAALVAGALFALGVALHLTERHAHRHMHESIVHEHVTAMTTVTTTTRMPRRLPASTGTRTRASSTSTRTRRACIIGTSIDPGAGAARPLAPCVEVGYGGHQPTGAASRARARHDPNVRWPAPTLVRGGNPRSSVL